MSNEWDFLARSVQVVANKLTELRADLRSRGVGLPPTPPPTLSAAAPSLRRLVEGLDTFPALVAYLNGRRPAGGVTVVKSEADVQDLLYLSLKPIFPELVYEQPTEKGAAGYSVGDFSIPSLKLILEAKLVDQKADVKAKADEIAEDIWKYTTQTDCERVIFFVYDPHLLIPDRPNYVRSLSARTGDFRSKGRDVEILTVVKS